MKEVENHFDLAVIGGGINGVGIALDAAGRGLKVLLCEMGDLSSSTSSKSSKLIHGGIRYLEHYEFKLVREALLEREILLKKAPHIIKPMRFVLPHRPYLRPAWLIRIGLFLYDNLAKRNSFPSSTNIKFTDTSPLKRAIKKGFEYSDSWVDDSRLVILNALDARNYGATIRNYTHCRYAKRQGNQWIVSLHNLKSNTTYEISSKVLINATGPWASQFINNELGLHTPKNIRLVKGSHIVVPKLHDKPEAYILQNEDGRIVFAIPYLDEYTLIGTTDVEFFGNPNEAKISTQEIEYLLFTINTYFKTKTSLRDIIHSYSGVRPLIEDGSNTPSSVTRDYTFNVEDHDGAAPILSVFGGKITTYRKLSELAVDKLEKYFSHLGPRWTSNVTLPGGDFKDLNALIKGITTKYPWLPHTLISRFSKSYGTLTFTILGNIKSIENMGIHFGCNLYEKEVLYLIKREWATNAEDVLWRRSKLGLNFNEKQKTMLESFISKEKTKHQHSKN